jgi:Polysaccharide lyase/Bacterial Ig-like domain (group 2)/Cellulose binding domain
MPAMTPSCLLLKVLLTLCAACAGAPAQAQVLWYGDPEEDYRKNFYRLSVEPDEPASVTVQRDPDHGAVWKVNKPAGSKRAELSKTNGYSPKEGDKVYIGWRMKVSIVGSAMPGGFSLFQNKSESPHSQNYPFTLGFTGTQLSLNAYDPGTGSQSSRGRNLLKRPLAEGEWVTLVLGVHFSRQDNIGYIELWLDGEKQTLAGSDSRKRVMHRTLDDSGNYFKWGAYNEASRDFDISVYLDEMRVAMDYASANPFTYEKTTVSVSGVSLSPSSLTLTPSQSRRLTAVVSPAKAPNRSVSYASSNPSVATVDPSGLVRAIAPGFASITVRTADGNKTDTTQVTVSAVAGSPSPPRPGGRADCTLTLDSSEDWGSGQVLKISLQNNCNQALENWLVEFRESSKVALDNSWGGAATISAANTVRIVPAVWNATVAARSLAQAGVQLRYSGAKPIPVEAAVVGHDCKVTVR